MASPVAQLILEHPELHAHYLDEDDDDDDGGAPILEPVTNEELRAVRAERRAMKAAEIQAKAEVFRRMGDELLEKGKYEESLIPYLEATNIWPSNVSYYVLLALAYTKLGWYEEVAHATTRALTLDPKSIEARFVRAKARFEQRLLVAAKIDLEIITTHEPDDEPAKALLVEVKKALEAPAVIAMLGEHTITEAPAAAAASSTTTTTEPASTTAGEQPTTTTTATTSSEPAAGAPATTTAVSKAELDFAYPHYDDTPLEVDAVSNSSDCHHRGNGVPCRFYNRGRCGKGTGVGGCPYSHAPDEKSVRDDLGRNVCIYFLLDSCKFGEAKCVYSHTREFLPAKGWWADPAQTEKIKGIVEMTEKAVKEQRSSRPTGGARAASAAGLAKLKAGGGAGAKGGATPRSAKPAAPAIAKAASEPQTKWKPVPKVKKEKKAEGDPKEEVKGGGEGVEGTDAKTVEKKKSKTWRPQRKGGAKKRVPKEGEAVDAKSEFEASAVEPVAQIDSSVKGE